MSYSKFLDAIPEVAQIEVNNALEGAPSSIERVAFWWCELNSYDWPEGWGDPPEWTQKKMQLAGRKQHEYKRETYSLIMNGLHAVCGHEAALRAWNVKHQKTMSEEDFDKWWSGRKVADL